ncbi:hypothetical protein C8Q72DRAFT_890461 [Fomitopsis betulina]|nr:hypothetical protein C8Q72DRAFT_890461 [Fomitopsis betulina]
MVSNPGRRSKGGQKRSNKGARRYKQELINSYDIHTSTLNMGTTNLGKTFDIIDMYKDGADATDKSFSRLESDAARVFRILHAAEKRDRSSVELRRSELNTLRNFLFILHYRRSGHAHQFIEGRFDAATAAMVEAYRVKHGLAGTRAVWLRNLALLLEDEHWEVANDERLLWTTRMDYVLHAYAKQLGIYRAPPNSEFVLTENGLGLVEGTQSSVHIMITLLIPNAPSAAFQALTQSFPITPKLVVLLRDHLLTQEAALIRGGMPAEEARRFTHQDLLTTSYFHDLPRTSPEVMHYPALSPQAFGWSTNNSGPTADEVKKFRTTRDLAEWTIRCKPHSR